MPKPARFTLSWSDMSGRYELYEHGRFLLQASGTPWLLWLNSHLSFAFCGKYSRLNLLKETRKQDSEGYWYAYQRQGKRTLKRYVGRSAEVMPARLEELASAFQQTQVTFSLLVPKFQLPRVSASLVQRERLLALLDSGMQRFLTLLTAPAGSGKTTLVAQWIAARKEGQEHFPPVAWVSLEKNDNDIVRFWRYVLTACGVFQPGCAQTALRQLAALSSFPPETPLLEAALTQFLNGLAQSACAGILVLDDYQVITSSHIHQALAFFLEYLPPSVHLILLTRGDPAFPLARLRARGALSEIDARDLRFSREETMTFFQQCFPALQLTEMIEQLDTLLEGWATGLRLFAFALQRAPTEAKVKQHLAGFMSGHRPLHDYFLEEVLNAQTASQQRFLLRTCLLGRLNAALCDAITGKRNSSAVLRSMERAGLFLERLDGSGQWYRYQSMFAAAMRAEARRRLGEETIQAILLQASRWYEQGGLLSEAIELALQAQEIDYAATMIERYLARRGFEDMQEFSTLRRWLEQLPTDMFAQYPLLCLHNAQILSLSAIPEPPPPATLAQMEKLLQMAETCWQAECNRARLGEVYAFRAYLALRQGRLDQICAYARQALDRLPATSRFWRAVCLNLSGSDALSRGQLARARTLFQEALALLADLPRPHEARNCILLLAMVHLEQGALHLASDGFHRVVQEAREVGDREDLVPALIGLAQLAYEWNDLEAAEQAAQEAWDVSEQAENREGLVRSAFVLARIWFLQGQKLLVQQRLTSLLARFSAHPALYAEVQLTQMHYWLAEGDVTTVQQHLDTLSIPEGSRQRLLWARKKLLQLRVLLAQQKYRQMHDNLQQLQEGAQGRMLLEIQLLLAKLQLAEKQVQDACRTLNNVLLTAHTEGYLRSFLDEGREIATLLRMARPPREEPPLLHYHQTILQAFGADQEVPRQLLAGPEALSQQEQRVLRLLVAELSYPEIARELIVSVNTVKTQVNSIYRKLNVHSRREARAVVRDLQLF